METIDDLVQQLQELDSDLAAGETRLKSAMKLTDTWSMRNHGGEDRVGEEDIEAMKSYIDHLRTKRALLKKQIQRLMDLD